MILSYVVAHVTVEGVVHAAIWWGPEIVLACTRRYAPSYDHLRLRYASDDHITCLTCVAKNFAT